jgi:hypothetical protein
MVNANDNGERKVKSLRDLPLAVEPPRDLWAGIEAQIAAERRATDVAVDADAGTGASDIVSVGPRKISGADAARRRRLSPRYFSSFHWMAAAAVVAALAVGMWIGRSVMPTTRPVTGPVGPGTVARQPPASNGASALQAAFVTDPKYRMQREALVKSLEAQLAGLPPDSRAKVISSLATIHKSMQDLEAALGKDPSNALLQELLVNTYQDEMRVLTTVHEASDAGKGI